MLKHFLLCLPFALLSATVARAQPSSQPSSQPPAMRLTDAICATCHNDPFEISSLWGDQRSEQKKTEDILAWMKRIHSGTLHWNCTKVESQARALKARLCRQWEWPKLVWEKTPEPKPLPPPLPKYSQNWSYEDRYPPSWAGAGDFYQLQTMPMLARPKYSWPGAVIPFSPFSWGQAGGIRVYVIICTPSEGH